MISSYIDANGNVNMLKLYFASEIPINDFITIRIPTIQDIIDFPGADSGFYSLLYIFCGNTTHFRVMLWDMGVDWNKISDLELFSLLIKAIPIEQTGVLFNDLDFRNFEYYKKKIGEDEDGKAIFSEGLYDPINDYVIDEELFKNIREILRTMFNIFPKTEVGIKKKRLKKEIIEYDRMCALKAKKESDSDSILFPMISTCLNHPGFKYKKDELKNVTFVEFMDSVQRLSVYEHSIATLRGMMSGFVDGSKVKPEQYNFMKAINNKPIDIKDQIKEAIEMSKTSEEKEYLERKR